ncbi:MAG TPA: glycosyltransferase [Pyrinomonadaceae bacterium]|nr:glycosyltransferase [Pyrinomonadaceae bacterium]
MKIVRIIARLNVGGPAKHVVWLTHGLRKTGWETLLVAGTVPEGEDDMSYFAAEQGVKPLFLQEMSREISPKDAVTIWKLFQLFRRERPDIVHTHTAKAGTVGRLAGLLYRWLTPSVLIGQPRKCVFIHTYHGHIFHSYYGAFKTRLFILIEKLLARLVTDRIVVISEQQRREINGQFGVGRPGQFAVIPLGLDLEAFSGWRNQGKSFRDELGIKPEEILVGIVGRLTEIKNHELFLKVVAELKSRTSSKPVRFVVIGDGALRNSLQQQAETLGIADEVMFVGSRRNLDEVYPALDIVALTSLNEGTPLTLIEGMANARPVISTAVGGVVDLLGAATAGEPQAGFMVCERGIGVLSHDPTDFVQGLVHFVANDGLRREIGERGLQFVERQYSKDRLLDDIEALYANLVTGKTVSVARELPKGA